MEPNHVNIFLRNSSVVLREKIAYQMLDVDVSSGHIANTAVGEEPLAQIRTQFY